PDAGELRGFLLERLPPYMVPAAFVTLPEFPLTVNGKVDRDALPAPVERVVAGERSFRAPSETLEIQLAGIWEQLLNVRPIGATDNFFEIGGDSLKAVVLTAKIEEVRGGHPSSRYGAARRYDCSGAAERPPRAAVFRPGNRRHGAGPFISGAAPRKGSAAFRLAGARNQKRREPVRVDRRNGALLCRCHTRRPAQRSILHRRLFVRRRRRFRDRAAARSGRTKVRNPRDSRHRSAEPASLRFPRLHPQPAVLDERFRFSSRPPAGRSRRANESQKCLQGRVQQDRVPVWIRSLAGKHRRRSRDARRIPGAIPPRHRGALSGAVGLSSRSLQRSYHVVSYPRAAAIPSARR